MTMSGSTMTPGAREGRLQVSFEGPSYFLGQNLPVEIRDARNHLVARDTGRVDLRLPPGLYVVEATLPGGRRRSEVVAVAPGEATDVVLDREVTRDVESFEWSLREFTHDVQVAELVDHRACTPRYEGDSTWTFDPSPGVIDETPRATFAVARQTATVSLPLNPKGNKDERGCTVWVMERGDRIRVDVGFVGRRRVASTLEGLVKSSDVVSTATLFSNAEDVLYSKYRDPSAAALGGMTLHRMGRLRERAGWVENLARDFRWVADGRILLAALLAEDSDPAERARGLRQLLEVAPVRPLFGDGLALLLQLLRSWPDESSKDERREAVASIPTDPTTVDWDAMALTNYDED